MKYFFRVVLVFVLFLSFASPVLAITSVTLNPAVKFQVFTGWEGTDYVGGPGTPGWPGYLDSLLNAAVNDYGLNRIRLELAAGVQNNTDYFTQYLNGQIPEINWEHCYAREPQDVPNYQWSSLDYAIDHAVLKLRQLSAANGEKFRVNLNFVSFNTLPVCPAGYPTGFRQYNDPVKYSKLILAAFQHMQGKYGFTPDTLEVILEPDNTAFDGTKIGNALKATQALLTANGFNPKYILPSTTNMDNAPAYFNQAEAVVGVNFISQYVQELSYHRYGGSNLSAIVTDAAQNHIGTSMLEWWNSSPDAYQTLYTDLTAGNNTAWQDGTILGMYGSNLQISDRSKFIRQYSKYIREGAMRIGASANQPGQYPLAFINGSGKYVVPIKTDRLDSYVISGLPGGTYGVYYTTGNFYNLNLPDISINSGQELNVNPVQGLGQPGVLTVYAKNGTSGGLIPGDLNADQKVNISDFRILAAGFGSRYSIYDDSEVIQNFGK